MSSSICSELNYSRALHAPMRRSRFAGIVLVATAVVTSGAKAGVVYDQRVIQLENDLFAGTDQQYTNGIRIAWASSPLPGFGSGDLGWAKILGSKLVLCAGDTDTRCYRVAKERWIAQNMYTPRDISVTQLQSDDRPYAGWLHFSDGWKFVSERNWHELNLDLGVVGPAALGEQAQKAIHELIDSPEPMGWSHQLKNEPVVQMSYRFRHKLASIESKRSGTKLLDVSPFIFGTIGNALDIGAVGVSLRAGWNIQDEFLDKMELVEVVASGARSVVNQKVRAYVFGQAEQRFVGMNIFIEGSMFREGHGLPKESLVSVYEWGGAVGYGAMTLSYRLATRGPEYRGQGREHTYGVLLVAFNPWCKGNC